MLRLWPLSGAPRGQFGESFAGLDKGGGLARCGLVAAAHDHVDVERIHLDAAADPTGRLGGDEGRARAEEGVEHDLAAVGEVEESVFEAWRWA